MELALSDCNIFITVNWDGRSLGIAVHRDCNFRCVGILLGSYFHVATINENVTRVESSLLVGICWMWREDQSTLNKDEAELWYSIDVHQKSTSHWNRYCFSELRRRITTPSGGLRPVLGILKRVTLIGCESFAGHKDSK